MICTPIHPEERAILNMYAPNKIHKIKTYGTVREIDASIIMVQNFIIIDRLSSHKIQ